MTTAELPFRWRSIALPALLPTLLFSTGEGAIIPIIPIAARNLGANLAIAGLVAALLMVGGLVGDVPSGWLVGRIGERPAMIAGALVSVLALGICLIAPNPFVLGIGIGLVGITGSVYALARHAFMTSFVPIAYRARALSILGGIFRLGLFVGPFITAATIHITGTAFSAFVVHLVCCLGAALVLVLMRDPTRAFETVTSSRTGGKRMLEGEVFVEAESVGVFRTIAANRGVLARLGTGAALIGAMRTSRAVILPLWALSIGLSGTNTALIIGIAGAVDFLLFYTSGQIMDRFGRLWSAVPSMLGLAAAHILLAFTHGLLANVEWFIFAAIFMSLANGIGSGLLMTLGADLADKRNPAPFLGAWRLTSDLGGAAAPLAVSLLVGIASISIAAGFMGVVGLVGAGLLARYVPRYIPKPEPRSPRGAPTDDTV